MEVLVGLIVVAALIAGLVIAAARWDRYRRVHGSPVAQPTTEVFVDPETGRRTRVWFDPSTGDREYREDGPPR